MEAKQVAVPRISDEAIIKHYGVRGMKWGVHRDRTPQPVVTITQPGKRVKSKGGKNQPPSEDAIAVSNFHRQALKSTTDSLSTKELQALVNRMNLEKQFAELEKSGIRDSQGKKFVKEFLNTADNKNFTMDMIDKGTDLIPGNKLVKTGVKISAVIAKAYVNKLGPKDNGGKKKK
jgi:molecular chaperone GrpE (heat shock protein)